MLTAHVYVRMCVCMCVCTRHMHGDKHTNMLVQKSQPVKVESKTLFPSNTVSTSSILLHATRCYSASPFTPLPSLPLPFPPLPSSYPLAHSGEHEGSWRLKTELLVQMDGLLTLCFSCI